MLELIIGAALPIAWAVYERRSANRERAERERIEALLREPVMLVTRSGWSSSDRGIDADYVVQNKGPTPAKRITCGIHHQGEQLAAIPTSPTMTALAVGESGTWRLHIGPGDDTRALAERYRQGEPPTPWLRFEDQLGQTHTVDAD